MIYYRVNTQYMNKFFHESTWGTPVPLLLNSTPLYTQLPKSIPSILLVLILQYIRWGGGISFSNLHLPFKRFLKCATKITMYKDLLSALVNYLLSHLEYEIKLSTLCIQYIFNI